MSSHSDPTNRDTNPDPLTGEPGSHPVSTGVGAAGGGAAGAAIGTAVAGPVGTVVGAVVGAVAGGYGGKAMGEAIDPTAEDAFWRDSHNRQPYASPDDRFEEFQPAYRSGYEGFQRHGASAKSFDEAEPQVRRDYEASGAHIGWDRAREASRAAWTRVHSGDATRMPPV
jgi:hypothetical protein